MDVTASTTEYRDITTPDGRIVIQARIDRHWDGTSITVAHSDSLGRQYPAGTEHEVDTYLAELEKLAAQPNATLRLIEEAAGALTSAAAVFDQAEQDLIDSINATMDEAQPATVDVSDILAAADPNWRRKLRAEVVQAAKHTNQRRDFTKGRVGCKPPTAAELHAIANHTVTPGGRLVVKAQPGQSWLTLRALNRRIPGEVTYKPGTLIITALIYRPEQLAAHLPLESAA